jgi:hypothetical protein
MPRGAKKGERRGGRKAGSQNKVTRAIKEAVLLVFDRMGENRGKTGEDEFLEWAIANQTEFYKIAARLIPHDAVGAGKDGEHVLKVIHQQIEAADG